MIAVTASISEEWRPVVGYEGLYEVSNMGRIRNSSGRMRVFVKHRLGYRQVNLSKNNKIRPFYVHRLVVSHFVGPIKDGLEVNHINGDKSDNCVSNLELCTRSENMKHAAEVLGRNRGEQSGMAKLTVGQVRQIKSMIGTVRVREIARLFNIKICTVSNIAAGRRWFYV